MQTNSSSLGQSFRNGCEALNAARLSGPSSLKPSNPSNEGLKTVLFSAWKADTPVQRPLLSEFFCFLGVYCICMYEYTTNIRK